MLDQEQTRWNQWRRKGGPAYVCLSGCAPSPEGCHCLESRVPTSPVANPREPQRATQLLEELTFQIASYSSFSSRHQQHHPRCTQIDLNIFKSNLNINKKIKCYEQSGKNRSTISTERTTSTTRASVSSVDQNAHAVEITDSSRGSEDTNANATTESARVPNVLSLPKDRELWQLR